MIMCQKNYWQPGGTYRQPGGTYRHLIRVFSTSIAPLVHVYLFLNTLQIVDNVESISCGISPLGHRVMTCFAQSNFDFHVVIGSIVDPTTALP